jgi:anti-anti-sigma regulatory factor
MLATAPGCDFEVQRGPDWLIVRVRNLDPHESDIPLADLLWSIMQQHFAHRLVLELDEVETLSRKMIGELLWLYRRIEEHDGVLRLCGLSARNRELLNACRMGDRLPPYEDRQEAVMGRPHFLPPR